ncbi:MAG: SDR family oxidoreductase [Anaerolineales bacterium]|nr:SDR family oxidoreductase [Anaerolineales bacterium]
MKIKGKTALITGGAVRVGKAMTLALAAEGANVVVNYNSSATAAQETATEAQTFGVGALAIQCDISHHNQVKAMIDTAAKEFGGIDILINSASWWRKTPFPMDDFSDWFKVFDILVHGSMYCCNYIAPMMKAAGEGAIINIVDGSAWRPFKGFVAHSVGKAGLLAFTRQLALELAPEIKVNAISPGPVLPPPEYTQAQNERVANRTPLKRWGTPQDVVDAMLYLVKSNYVTGEFITVDGGEKLM